MGILVQKFGGTSLSTAEARYHVIQHIKHALSQSYQLVVVVSAMGRRGEPYATDTLLELVRKNGDNLPPREKDMLLYCGEMIAAAVLCSLLHAESIPAVVLNGGQAGIRTNDHYGDAHILTIRPNRILAELERRNVVIVTGFQGAADNGDITTLGRGGSDTSATALGVALKADIVDIFTDVDGILTADPRIVENAKQLEYVTYTEICNMAYNGAKVIHPRAVEVAMQAGMPVRVRSTFSTGEGTLVTSAEELRNRQVAVTDRIVTGIAHVSGVTQIRVDNRDARYDLQLHVFRTMAANRISVDFINVNPSGVVYTVFEHDAVRAVNALREVGFDPLIHAECAKVSIIGGGMNGVPGIMARIVEALTEAEVPILQSADSNATIWVLVKGSDMVQAVRALHDQFELGRLN